MRHFSWRAAALTALTILVFTTYAVAQQPAGGAGPAGAGQSNTGSSQGASSSSSGQSQNQGQATSDDNKNTSSTQSDNTQSSRDAKSSQDQTKQDQSNQYRDNRSSNSSRSDERSSTRSRDRDDRDANYDRDRDRDRDMDRDRDRDRGRDRDSREARDNRDDRSNVRDRSDRNEDRNAERRSDRDSGRDSMRDRSSRRGNMRGPDIGLWFNRSSRDRLEISDVSSKGAISRFGFREGDRIVSVDGRRVTREDEFIDFLRHSDARRVKVIVLRDNREETIFVEPAILFEENEYVEEEPLEQFGVVLDDRYDDRIVVWRVIPRSPAFYAGFRSGDVITTFGGRPFRTRTEFERGARDWKTGETNVQVRRGERTRDLSVDVPRFDRSERRSERTAQRESTFSDQRGSDQRIIDQSNRPATDQGNAPRRGILNGVGRGRGNR